MPFNAEAARRVQERLAKLVVFAPIPKAETVAGLDVAYSGDVAYGAAVVVKMPALEVVDVACSVSKAVVPYVPTYLAFRELSPMLRAYFKLRVKPDIILVDGHGVAHPRRFGIASHIGVVLKKPTIGVAKSRLYGVEEGGCVLDPSTGEVLAQVVKCGGKKYVSVGSYATLEDAVRIVETLCKKGDVYPLRAAHEITQKIKKAALPHDEDRYPCS
ncbi:MAG: endonuclease V [Pyrobaculum arsenaticum]|uniref:Endonuclease V n=2 Tax=Pyrobaculum arsenaticum TaxID=121277 RepID=A4WNB5_PYRAR|nr:endonuclease V [Pyrobaculum arsenaticum]ABP51882.1 Endonuclease V [Pyrobaculum arsenaticum DSM 13514]MCY0891424.1 endonuclease V [Pyrobaculum arsenaticum]NYR16201.1 endonuclease V [Pyrobaculum arsenaticum]